MPSNYSSPFTTSFKSAIKRGMPFMTAVANIAKRNNKSTDFVCNSLFKAGVMCRQKFNGSWLYWPTEMNGTFNATSKKECRFDMWQSFVQWALCCGFTTPEKLNDCASTQADFEAFCKKFWSKQFTTNSRTRPTSKSKTRTSRGTSSRARKTTTARKNTKSPRSRTSTAASRKRATTSRTRNATTARKRTTTSARKRTTSRSSSPTMRFTGASTRRSTSSSYRRAA